MNNQNLIIYDFPVLFDVLNEIKNNFNFNIINVSKNEYNKLKIEKLTNFLIISKKKQSNLDNQILIENYPYFFL